MLLTFFHITSANTEARWKIVYYTVNIFINSGVFPRANAVSAAYHFNNISHRTGTREYGLWIPHSSICKYSISCAVHAVFFLCNQMIKKQPFFQQWYFDSVNAASINFLETSVRNSAQASLAYCSVIF